MSSARTPRAGGRSGGVILLAAAGAIAFLAGGIAATSREPRRALMQKSPALERRVAAGRLRLLETYGPSGSLWLVQADEAELLSAEKEPGGRPGRRIVDVLSARSRLIDTAGSRPIGSARPGPGGGRLEWIQFHGPIKRRWLREMKARAGARPVAYVPHNGYLLWVEQPGGLDGAELPLRWRESLRREDRVSPDLVAGQDPVRVTVQVVRAGRHDALVEEIRARALSILMPPSGSAELTSIRALLPPEMIADLASRPEVAWIEPFDPPVGHDERTSLIVADQVAQGRPLMPGYLEWLEAHGLGDLSQVLVDVTDTGVDVPFGGHPGLAGRLAYSIEKVGDGLLEDCAGHGTNIAGIIAGAPVPGADQRDADGYRLGLGVAPTARIGSTRIFTCQGVFAPAVSYTGLVSSAYAQGARIGNNSWGGTGNQYNSIAAEYDAAVRDADGDPANGDQPFLPIFSSGNLGPTTFSVGWPATAKNVLSVGATEGFRPGLTDGCGTSGINSDSVDHVLSLSSRGPTGDGRIKPDLVAPGSHVQSLASTSRLYSGLGVCDLFFPPGQRLMNWSTGTSQAAAHVTGVAAIAAELYRRRHAVEPSPAMLKAILINHAHDMGSTAQAPTNTTSRPNFQQGWGRADLEAVVEAGATFAFDQEHLFLDTGESISLGPFQVEDPSRPALITLAWTDPPGIPGGWSWVNDLNLSATAAGQTYFGNVFQQGVSIPGGAPDFRNNVETIVLPAGTRTFDLVVEAANLAGDGVPSQPGETDQDFALYASNARLPGGSASVEFAGRRAACGESLGVRLADGALRGLGRALVRIESGADRETVILLEESAPSGLFSGSIDVAAGAASTGDGVVQTADGASIVVTHQAQDPAGVQQLLTAAVTAICRAPAIQGATVKRVGDARALVTWTTDHASDSVVQYGPGVSPTLTARDAKLVREHRVQLGGLTPCTFYTATVASTNEAGLSSSGPVPPLRFSTGPGSRGRRIVLRDDMEALGTRWRHAPAGPAGLDDWELGFPAAAPGAFSGTRAWGTNLDGNYRVGADSVLTSPPIDLTDALGSQLSFLHFHSLPGGLPPISRNDGAWVEISADGGATWAVIDPVGGYPDTIDLDNPWITSGSGVFAGATPGWIRATFDLSSYDGGVVQVRMRLWQDAAESTATGAGWFIDDVEVTAEGSCHAGRLRFDSPEYGCSSRPVVRLSDSHLNLSASSIDSVPITVAAPSGSIPVSLIETATNSGEFSGVVELSPAAAPGRLAVSESDTIVASYLDADSGGGQAASLSAQSLVSDCTPPPPPAGFSVQRAGAGRLDLTWTPPDPAAAPDLQGFRVHYDTDGSGPVYGGTGARQGGSPVRIESAEPATSLSSLASCIPYFITVTSFDAMGNESVFAPERYAVAEHASSPCALGRLAAAPAEPGCREPVTVTVADANADPDPSTAGEVTVTLRAEPTGGSLVLRLSESLPASGLFSGTAQLSPSPAQGTLAVSEGDDVILDYLDADDGRGLVRASSVRLEVKDCTGPVITNVRVTQRAGDRATLRWTTDEPATSHARFGSDPSVELVAQDSTLVTEHALVLSGFSPCSQAFYAISSTDARGNTGTAGLPGSPLQFGTFREVELMAEDFESGAPGWTHQALLGGNDEWELGPPAPGVPGGPPAAWSGLQLWGTDLDGAYEEGADMALISPPIDLRTGDSALLTFRHWYSIYSNPPGSGFDDGGFVEVSADDGATWTYIEPIGGYPDRIADNFHLPSASGAYAAASGGWLQASFRLDPFLGQVVRIRFHLLEDPREPSFNASAGWYIDDVAIHAFVACHDGQIQLDRSFYACNGDSAELRVFDRDLDGDTSRVEQALARAASLADPAGLPIDLTETGPSTGIFTGRIFFSSDGSAGTLVVRDGDQVEAAYDDADDGSGQPRRKSAFATIEDCEAPALTGVTLGDVGHDHFSVSWTTSEPADSRVLYGPDSSLGESVVVAGARTQHSVTVQGLASCANHLFTVASADASGNLARDDAQAGLRSVRTSARALLLSESFEAGAPGWVHLGRADAWTFQTTGSGGLATIAPAGLYARPGSEHNADFSLVSPFVDLSESTRPTLTLLHRHGFPSSNQGGDGGWVEAWDGHDWIPLVPEGGYPGFIDPEAGRTGDRIAGYSGASGGTMQQARFDLGDLAGRLQASGTNATRVRFRVFVEGGVGPTGEGWMLDEVRIEADLTCQRGRLSFGSPARPCGRPDVPLRLDDRDPGVSESVVVTARSSGGPAELPVTLVEQGPASGLFAGSIPLSRTGEPGSLRAEEGDIITALYHDADDGTGSPREATAFVRIGSCSGPGISRIRLSALPGGAVLAAWRTDRPATSEATLTPASGPRIEAADPSLSTAHSLVLHGAQACTAYEARLASEDSDGARAEAPGPGGVLTAESLETRTIFLDDMEGPDPGWVTSGFRDEWQRGAPQFGPPGAFSGQRVFGTDLTGNYDGGTNSTLTTPPIDLTGVASARLDFWHWFDIFADGAPNSTDDAGWVEVLDEGSSAITYLEPIGGYPDTADGEQGSPLTEGTPAYAGQSADWEHAELDLTRFAGRVVRIRFRLWNDLVELLLNGRTGAGWYLDDVRVTSVSFCHPAPSLQGIDLGVAHQAEEVSGLIVAGAELRAGASVDLGPGVVVTSSHVEPPSRITLDLQVDPGAPLGARDLVVTNPDGQQASAPAALKIVFDPRRADADGSGRVDGQDLVLFATAFGAVEGEIGYDARADLNADGFVDGLDLALLAAHFGSGF